MARKFKTGDRVKVCVSRDESEKTGGYCYDAGIRKGCTGVVSDYDVQCPDYPYEVRMKKNKALSPFNARELEKIK